MLHPPSAFNTPVTRKELDVLQHLAGYIVTSFTRKIRRRSTETDATNQVLTMLQAMTDNGDKVNQRYINTLDRGGLTATRKEMHDIFLTAEKKFRSSDFLRTHSIDCFKLAVEVSRDMDVYASFNSILSDVLIPVEKEYAVNLLEEMLILFFRVRSFSAARAITIKHRVATKSQKMRGLRKNIKGKEQ